MNAHEAAGSGPRASVLARFDELIEVQPVFRALLRSIEEELVARELPHGQPLLDLGCGDGVFGARALGERPAVGIDPDTRSLATARSTFGGRDGRLCARATGTALPFADRSIATIVSNSVLEHIEPLDETLDECARVLRPGGVFVLTSPNPRFSRELLGARLPRALGLDGLATAYARWFNGHSQHHHLLDQPAWRARLESRGFEIEAMFDYFPGPALRRFDLLHPLGVPAWISQRLFGRWVVWRSPWTRWAARRWLTRWLDPLPHEGGCYTFLRARRNTAS